MAIKPWEFVADMNADGVFTLSDIIEIFIQLFFLPGDSLLFLILNYLPKVTELFELSYDDYHGMFAGIVSFIVWVFLIPIIVNGIKLLTP
ncbi:MAG: hypothetical protein H8D96_18120 [Desulfobacterales bacterium]|uniref:EF-hand domain-containing protein n=1 Tax=Candidatus Desulfatibia vada TaxID=2841696 RepID=A0A8J6NTT3_9BACT|nr:hypothetical protein [Candidatus Desulfatibia vada]